jgi:glycosyltransferase involved in cell wall biosynthesis
MLQILDYGWHQGHSYRLHALPAEFTYVDVSNRQWTLGQRPMPPNFRGIISPEEVVLADYDLALLHLDQWCDERFNLRATPYRLMKQITEGIPQVVIMHGIPDYERNRLQVLNLIGDLPVVCNSFQAAREWDSGDGRIDRYGCLQFRTIIHGYDVDEFYNMALEGREVNVITVCSGGYTSRKYHGIPLLERLMRDIPLTWYGPSGNADWLPNYDAYRDMLATSLIYFSPTRRAPMPGARTEAMLSGCCIVTVPGHDARKFITHEKTGFLVRTYEEARDTLAMLLRDPQRAWDVGRAGREVARALFHKGRFAHNWLRELWRIGVDIPEYDIDKAMDECDPARDILAFLGWPEIF